MLLSIFQDILFFVYLQIDCSTYQLTRVDTSGRSASSYIENLLSFKIFITLFILSETTNELQIKIYSKVDKR